MSSLRRWRYLRSGGVPTWTKYTLRCIVATVQATGKVTNSSTHTVPETIDTWSPTTASAYDTISTIVLASKFLWMSKTTLYKHSNMSKFWNLRTVGFLSRCCNICEQIWWKHFRQNCSSQVKNILKPGARDYSCQHLLTQSLKLWFWKLESVW